MKELAWFAAWEWINIALEYTSVAWVRLPRFFLAVTVVNLLTHPVFVYVLGTFGRSGPVVAVSETVIFLVEAAVLALLYGRTTWRRTTLAAFVMNATSFLTGLLLG